MKNFVLLFILISGLTYPVFSQDQRAVTESGEEVVLHKDGTWEYVNKTENTPESEIWTNPKKYVKSAESTFLLKSAKTNIGVWLDPKKWKFNKATNNAEAEYELQLKGEDLYGMIITEKVEIPVTTLKDLAIENAKLVASDVKIVKEEYRNVNGLSVLFMQINGELQGIKFSYYGYYYSSDAGTVQFITYTSQNLLNDYLKEIETLLGGFVRLD